VYTVRLEGQQASAEHGVPPGSYVRMDVADNGVGMDAATQARVFEPFFSTKGPGRGTGLGLATVFGIVQQNGGNISVRSEPTRGTRFLVLLPQIDAAPSAAAPAPAPAPPLARSATILVVEDDAQLRALVSGVLRAEGHTVLEAEDPLQALERAGKHPGPIDLLLTDVVMPHMSGVKLAERLLPTRPEMRVVYTSGHTEDTILTRGALDPSVRFLPKPVVPGTLRNMVNEVLRGG
jgi:two-component system, cell cycle sensor histidine kinase and response regulator CckA